MLSSTTAAAGAEEGPRYDTRLHTYDAAVDLAPPPSAPLTVGETGASQSESVIFPGPVDLRHIYDPVRSFVAPASAVDDLLGAACRTNSFVPGTEVLMADGTTEPIEDVEIGDWVWAHDPETGETGARRVVDTIVGDGEKQLVDIEVLGDTVTATAGHPFWVDDEGRWVDAGELEVGDRLLLPDGSSLGLTGVEGRVEAQRVHNLTVEGVHTYYVSVGDEQVLVHNCIRGTQGLEHSFDRHAAQWFGRDVARSTHMEEWTALLERASGGSQRFDWQWGGDLTTTHLATIDNKPFVVSFFQEGPRVGEVATALVPSQSQLSDMYAILRG